MEQNKSFIFGVVAGGAVVSSIALIGLLIYIFTGGRSACLAQCSGEEQNTSKIAKEFEACLDSDKYDSKIQNDQNLGIQLGVRGTPASFINGYLISGALPYDMVKMVIDDILAGKEPTQEFLKDSETEEIVKIDMPVISPDDHQTGATNGQITLLEFSDFECPYCSRYKATVDQVLENYGDKVTVVFKQFPLSFHQYAQPAAVASECAAKQGKFWEMYDKLFDLSGHGKLTLDTIKSAAVELGLK